MSRPPHSPSDGSRLLKSLSFYLLRVLLLRLVTWLREMSGVLSPIGTGAIGESDVVRLSGLEFEPIKVHYLVPCRDEVAHELLLRIVRCVYLGQRPEL